MYVDCMIVGGLKLTPCTQSRIHFCVIYHFTTVNKTNKLRNKCGIERLQSSILQCLPERLASSSTPNLMVIYRTMFVEKSVSMPTPAGTVASAEFEMFFSDISDCSACTLSNVLFYMWYPSGFIEKLFMMEWIVVNSE